MGSVKALAVDREPTVSELGRGTFEFSDAYSVFDWGPMPSTIPDKGASLCAMGAATFEALEDAGVPTHYLGVGRASDPQELAELTDPPTEMAIEVTRVPDLPVADDGYDYETYHRSAGEHYLIPLEVIYRNEVPVGSSLRRRSEPADHDLDYAEWPDHSIELAVPIVEYSTKFESTDRYLDRDEAAEIAGEASLEAIDDVVRTVNRVVSDMAEIAGLSLLDGKIECLWHDRTVNVADVAGTLDENRFAAEGRQLSKEVLRQYHTSVDPEWVSAVSRAKREAASDDDPNWKARVAAEPGTLPSPVIETISAMYGSVANAYIDQQLFGAPPVHAVADSIGKIDGA